MKPCKQFLIIFTAILITNGYYGQSYKMQGNHGEDLKGSVISLITTIHEVIKKYKSQHTISSQGLVILGKNNPAKKCRETKRLSLVGQANEIMKILQEFVGDLQQMQIDEMTFHKKEKRKDGEEVTRALRILEYDLRDLVEEKLRRFIKEYIGPVAVIYSLGSLPSTASSGAPDLIASKHFYTLDMLRSCITDILCMDKWLPLMNDNSTKELLRPSIC